MTATAVREPLWHPPAIGLDELLALAALQTRVDRKYVVPLGEVDALLAAAVTGARVLEIDGARSFAYESLYFDTPDLLSYRLTAYRRRRRFKIRTRCYLDSGDCWLEVKTAGQRGSTVKNRSPYALDDRASLHPGRPFVRGALEAGAVPVDPDSAFVPTLITRYQRTTLYLPDTASRVTVDTRLTWEDAGRRLHLPGVAIIETKSGSTTSWADRLLWRRGHRPARISKYATGLAALRPELPAPPWRQTLRRHFVPTGRTVATHSTSWL
ncbi:VTC domain-containing protein [Luedemannella flava]|uniref:VTC domain-containing protein n=1 Tax=Luedemannella flava TaxID=349316 RepID=A0ABN2MMJ8_9ACTN